MKKKKLTIVDLDKYADIKVYNSNIIFVNKGKVDFENSKIIRLNINKKKKFKNLFLKDIEFFFENLKKKFKKKLKFISPQELEIFNLRNDKITYFEKLCLILYVKKFEKNFKSIDLITDNEEYSKIYSQVYKNIKLNILKKDNFNYNFSLRFNFYKFLIKSIYFIFLSKIIMPSTNQISINKIISLSIYPYFFDKKNQINIYGENNGTRLNFSLTDETHLNLKFNKYFNHIINLKKIKNILNVENFIKLKDYFSIINKFNKDFKVLNDYLNRKKIKFRGIDVSYILIEHIWISFLNRYKLSIYDNALKRFFAFKKIKQFNYFLFEYSFGFYLSRIIKIKQQKFKMIGYQHGFFSKYLLWLKIINKDNEKKTFLPDKIICNQKDSYNIYKKYFEDVQLVSKKFKPELFPKIDNMSKNILVFTGQHDLFDIYNYFLKNKKFINNNIFIKLHPNNKKKVISEINNIKIVKKINYKITYKVYMSPTTTMTYMYKRFNKKFNLIKFDYKFNLQ